MLNVNLLPEDRRQRERTPLPRFIVLLVGVAIITSEIAVCGYGYMQWQTLLQEQEQLQSRKKNLQPKVDTFNELQQDINQLEQRQEILEEIRPEGLKEKYQWSYAIDQLFTVIDESPGVWIEDLSGQMEQGGGRGASASLTLSFSTKGAPPFSRLTNFQQQMKQYLIDEKGVFTNLDRTWYPYDENESEVNTYWSTDYQLKRVTKEN